MSQITIRGMDPAIERKIRQIAKNKGKSLNCVILDMLYQSAGLHKQGRQPAAYSPKKLAGSSVVSRLTSDLCHLSSNLLSASSAHPLYPKFPPARPLR